MLIVYAILSKTSGRRILTNGRIAGDIFTGYNVMFNCWYGLIRSDTVRVSVRHRAKFRADRSNRCRDMAIFSFFSQWQLSAIWNLSYVRLNHPLRVNLFAGLVTVQHLAGFGAVVSTKCFLGYASFNIACVRLEMRIHAPQIVVLGYLYFTPNMESSINATPKRHLRARKYATWRIV